MALHQGLRELDCPLTGQVPAPRPPALTSLECYASIRRGMNASYIYAALGCSSLLPALLWHPP